MHGTRSSYLSGKGKGKERESQSGDPDDCEDMWEAFRMLGSALHTLEDLLAHSECHLLAKSFLRETQVLL